MTDDNLQQNEPFLLKRSRFTLAQVARLTGVSRQAVYNWTNGDLSSTIGDDNKTKFVEKSELIRFAAARGITLKDHRPTHDNQAGKVVNNDDKVKLAELQVEVKMLREMNDELKVQNNDLRKDKEYLREKYDRLLIEHKPVTKELTIEPSLPKTEEKTGVGGSVQNKPGFLKTVARVFGGNYPLKK